MGLVVKALEGEVVFGSRLERGVEVAVVADLGEDVSWEAIFEVKCGFVCSDRMLLLG